MLFIPRIELSPDSLIRADVTFHYRHYHRNGKLKRRDTHNGIKVILDLIAEKCGFDDSIIKSGSWASVDDDDEKVIVILTQVYP